MYILAISENEMIIPLGRFATFEEANYERMYLQPDYVEQILVLKEITT